MESPTVFVARDFAGTSAQTATLLVGTAEEFKIDQHEIAKARGGYMISERLHKVLYDEGVFAHTSGNRAEENTSEKEQ